MLEFITNTFIVFFVVIDPIGVAPIFAALTANTGYVERRKIAFRGTAIASIILLLFAFGGHVLLSTIGISLDAFRIAGGVLLFLLAIDMVFARQSGLRSTTPTETDEAANRQDISVFPLAIPLLAGPGAMTTLLLMIGEANARPEYIAAVIVVLLCVLLCVLIALLSAPRILALLGETGTNVISRVLGVLLASLAVQYMLDGLQGSIALVS